MNMMAIIPILVMLAGLLTHALSNNSKVSELGRLAFFAGLLVTLMVYARYRF